MELNEVTEMETDEMTVDRVTGLRIIRRTDNSAKEGDLEAPQVPEPLALDENGLPEFIYDSIEGVV